jgi:hypothetical protein
MSNVAICSVAQPARPDDPCPTARGWNRIHLLVHDIGAEVARLRAAGVSFRKDVVTGPGGKQILIDDPSGSPIELFSQPQLNEYEAHDDDRNLAGAYAGVIQVGLALLFWTHNALSLIRLHTLIGLVFVLAL